MKKAFKKKIELKKMPKMNIIDSDILNKYKEYNVILDRINKGLNKYHYEMLCSKCHLSQQTYALKLHKKYRACYICNNCAINVRNFKARFCNKIKCYYPRLVQIGTEIVAQPGSKNRCRACRKYCMGIGQTNKTDFFKMNFRGDKHDYNEDLIKKFMMVIRIIKVIEMIKLIVKVILKVIIIIIIIIQIFQWVTK